jgi:hypothetical protein
MNKTFHYSILRYRHSYLLQEEVNVGLLFFFEQEKLVRFLYPASLQRISSLYPDISLNLIKKYLKTFERAADRASADLQHKNSDLFKKEIKSYIDSHFISEDATALYFTELKSGSYKNTDETLKYYEDRFLSVYAKPEVRNYKDEKYILRKFTDAVRKRGAGVTSALQKNIQVSTDILSRTFEYGWKNHITHLITPVGFDLQHSESIKSKACEWQGILNTLAETAQEKGYQFDIIVSRPAGRDLFKAYDQGLQLIDKAPAHKEVIEEEKINRYSEKIAGE